MTTTPHPAAPSVSVESEEYVLVPREPTSKMVDAGERAYLAMVEGTAEAGWMEQVIYRAMIAAAPTPNPSPAAKSGDAEEAELEDRIDNAVQAMSETHHSWEARCHAIMAALGFNFGWADPKIDAETPSPLATPSPQPADAVREVLDWPAPKVTNTDIANPTGVPYLDCLLHRLLDAQQEVNEQANSTMSQPLADVSALMDEIETAIRKFARAALTEPAPAGEAVEPVGYLKPETPHAEGSRFVYAKDRNEDWMRSVFTIPVYDHPAPEDSARLREAVEPVAAGEATRLWWFLHILNACGTHGTYANDEPGEWVAAFCGDAEPTDTFNLACNLKLAIYTHNSMDETSRIWINDDGKAWLAAHPAPEDTARLREDLERVTLALSNANDRLETLYADHAAEKYRADTAERDRDDARKALEEAATWHDAQDKAISKQPNANVGHNGWMRSEHQEQANILRAAARSASREATP